MSKVLVSAPPLAFLPRPFAVLALLFSGAMFGFFYAWVCSTVWGLDAADPTTHREPEEAHTANVAGEVQESPLHE